MKSQRHYQLLIVTTLRLFLLVAVPLQSAHSKEVKGWTCRTCPYQSGWYGTLELGVGIADGATLHSGDFLGITGSGSYPLLEGDIHYRGEDGGFIDLRAERIGLKSRQLQVSGGKRGHYTAKLSYKEVPKYRGQSALTPFLGVGSDQLTLPESWQSSFSTQQMSSLDSSAREIRLATKRQTWKASVKQRINQQWHYEVGFQRQKKSGTRPFSAGLFLINAAQLPAPVDFTTDLFNMEVRYAGKKSSLSLRYDGSGFQNGASSITWENPFTSSDSMRSMSAALEPDNSSHSLSLSAAHKLSPTVRVNGSVRLGEMKQNDTFLAYTTNPNLVTPPPPRTSLAGDIQTGTFNLAGRLTARLTPKVRLNAQVKVDEKDNRTPIAIYEPVLTDFFRSGERANIPYSYKRSQARMDLKYRANRKLHFRAGIKRVEMERDRQEVRQTADRTIWGEVRIKPWSGTQFRMVLDQVTRDITPYEHLEDIGPDEHPLLRKYNMAARDRRRSTAELSVTPTEILQLTLSYHESQDDYRDSVIGLLEGTERNFNIEGNLTLGPGMSAYLYYSKDVIDASLAGAASATADPWAAETEDHIMTTGVGLTGRVGEKTRFGIDFVASNSTGRIATDSGAGEAPFPALTTNYRSISVYADYQANDRWGWKLSFQHQSDLGEDWSLSNLGLDGIGAVLTMGQTSPDYSSNLVWLSARYAL